MEKRNNFTFYRSFVEAMVEFPEQEWLGFLMAVIHYALDRRVDENLTGTQRGMFKLVRPVLDAAWNKAENGMRGGTAPKAKRKQTKSKKEVDKEVEKEIENETDTDREPFARFWGRYPLKLGRKDALRAWVCVCKKYGSKAILDGLDRWVNCSRWGLEEGRFIPKAEKWLKEEWFLQKPQTDAPTGAAGRIGPAELEAIQKMFK